MKWIKRDSLASIEEVIERNTGFSIKELKNCDEETPISNLDRAISTISSFITDKKPITIFGDYDADGITSSSILWATIMTIGKFEPGIRLPRRFSEGFGFSPKAASEINEGLLITVDNGIAAIEAIKIAKEKGITVVVLDHHLPGDVLPNADVIVDPHLYKVSLNDFEDWCGAGIAYRVCKRLLLESTIDENLKEAMMAYITQLSAIGTVCDVMPLIKDNRKIVIEGLNYINSKPCKGLKAILEMTETAKVDETTCGFLLGPLLNAAGRMEDDGALLAFDVLTACRRTGAKRLKECIQELIVLNDKRKADVNEALELVHNTIENECLFGDCPLIVSTTGINEGIIGIVASKLVEEYRVPTIVLTESEGNVLKGSARSFGSASIISMLNAAKDYLIKFGGHEGAGGLSVKPENLYDMKSAMQSSLSDYTCENPNELYYDLDLSIEDLANTIEKLKEYAPYGEGNPKIVFKIDKFVLSPRLGRFYLIMGSENNHLKLYGNGFSALGFGLAKKYDENASKECSCIGTLSENLFRGKKESQIEMLDFKHLNENKKSALAELLAQKMSSL